MEIIQSIHEHKEEQINSRGPKVLVKFLISGLSLEIILIRKRLDF